MKFARRAILRNTSPTHSAPGQLTDGTCPRRFTGGASQCTSDTAVIHPFKSPGPILLAFGIMLAAATSFGEGPPPTGKSSDPAKDSRVSNFRGPSTVPGESSASDLPVGHPLASVIKYARQEQNYL